MGRKGKSRNMDIPLSTFSGILPVETEFINQLWSIVMSKIFSNTGKEIYELLLFAIGMS